MSNRFNYCILIGSVNEYFYGSPCMPKTFNYVCFVYRQTETKIGLRLEKTKRTQTLYLLSYIKLEQRMLKMDRKRRVE